jgi:hypothetical protein
LRFVFIKEQFAKENALEPEPPVYSFNFPVILLIVDLNLSNASIYDCRYSLY